MANEGSSGSGSGNGAPASTRNQFGAFAGVFTPSVLTILGVIMFLRAGFVVGQAGIYAALIILCVSEAICYLTALSMSTIATNTDVKGGGAYFLISRVLGPQFGVSIGLALWLGQALSVPFYVLGFTHALVRTFPVLSPFLLYIAIGVSLVLFAITYIGANWAIKSQYVVMAMLGLAILAFLGGGALRFDPELFASNWISGYTGPNVHFWVIFAIYFPAVTGILAGINMSGDLRDPGRSLVRGTFAAITVGFAIYLLQILVSGGSQARPDLIDHPYEMLVRNAVFKSGFLVIGGVFAATLSSAMGSFLGAPRVLQALARDRILPGLSAFARGSAKGDEPRAALLLTLLITLFVIKGAAGGDSLQAFDVVAALVTMFFLCTYGMINLAAFVESFGANPSFRPRFRLGHWTASLLGALACLGVMIRVDLTAAVAAVIVIAGLYVVVSRRVFKAAFGDARRGFMYSIVRRGLQRLEGLPPHAKNWRPTFLVLCGSPKNRLTLVRYGVWMEARRGIVTAGVILIGDSTDMAALRQSTLVNLKKLLAEDRLYVFPEVVMARDMDEAIRLLVQSHSIGPIKPNTVLMGWPHETNRIAPYFRHLRDIRALGKSVLCVIEGEKPAPGLDDRRIDVWWHGRRDGSLMLILAHLLRSNREWRDTTIRLVRAVADEAGRAPARADLERMIHTARLDAAVQIIVSDEPLEDLLHDYSRHSTVVFLGFDVPEQDAAIAFHRRFEELLRNMPTAILVCSSGEADLLS